jgi:hypothetical protein
MADGIGGGGDFPAGLPLSLLQPELHDFQLQAIGFGLVELTAPSLREVIAALLVLPQRLCSLFSGRGTLLGS